VPVRKITAAVILCVVAALVVVLMAQGQSTDKTPRQLTGQTLDGSVFDLSTISGKPVVINFWGSWCKWCAKEAPDLVAFAKAHPDVMFVGVDAKDDDSAGRAFAAKYGFPFQSVIDHAGTIADEYGVSGYPTTVFLDSKHIERARIVGAGNPQDFLSNLKKVL
jgi:thiol-disulfide isomerase/thioredoxin